MSKCDEETSRGSGLRLKSKMLKWLVTYEYVVAIYSGGSCTKGDTTHTVQLFAEL